MGDLIPFPTKRTCFRCQHYDEEVAHCLMFDESIDSEVFAAKDCHAYEEVQP